jgi:hypothetical protein
MDPELFERMQEAALRFRSGESDVEEIMTPNGIARLVRDPTNDLGFRIDFVGEGAKHSVAIQHYPPSPTRPPGYPAPLPFLANSRSTVDTLDQTVSWPDADPKPAFRAVARACLEDGWAEVSAGTGEAVFEKDGAERTLRLVRTSPHDPLQPSLVLRERRLAPK